MRRVHAHWIVLAAVLGGCERKAALEDPTLIRPAEVLGPTVEYPKRGFSVTVPQGWRKGEDATFVRLQSPVESAEDYPATVNILVEAIPLHIRTNEDYLENGMEMMRSAFDDFRVLGSNPDAICERPAIASIFTMKDKGRDLKILSYAFLAGGNGHIITCSAALDDFDRYRELFAGIAKSVKLR